MSINRSRDKKQQSQPIIPNKNIEGHHSNNNQILNERQTKEQYQPISLKYEPIIKPLHQYLRKCEKCSPGKSQLPKETSKTPLNKIDNLQKNINPSQKSNTTKKAPPSATQVKKPSQTNPYSRIQSAKQPGNQNAKPKTKDNCDCNTINCCQYDTNILKYEQMRKLQQSNKHIKYSDRQRHHKKQYIPYYEEQVRVEQIQKIRFVDSSSSDSDTEKKPIIRREYYQDPNIIRLQPQIIMQGENINQQKQTVIHHYHPGPYKEVQQSNIMPAPSNLSPDIHRDRENERQLDPLNLRPNKKPVVQEKVFMKPQDNAPYYEKPADRKRYETPPIFDPMPIRKPAEPIIREPPLKPIYRIPQDRIRPPKQPIIVPSQQEYKINDDSSQYICECESECEC